MKNVDDGTAVGDAKSPPLEPTSMGLRYAVDNASLIPAISPPPARITSPSESLAKTIKSAVKVPQGCLQNIWISFFFDGTGNNRDADFETKKHSNVAKLSLVHVQENEEKGIYQVYVPGVGTYFKEVGDNGASKPGSGFGYMGDKRLIWAIDQFDERMKLHLAAAKNNPRNKILEINIAVFGFSRGSALARAFVNDFIKKRTQKDPRGLRLANTDIHVRFRFMGLFDTVASVGMPMSSNTTSIDGIENGIEAMLKRRLNAQFYNDTIPSVIAFSEGARPGADPAPGVRDGHIAWGGRIEVPALVEDVRHFIAAHEIRNSFPVESLSILKDGKVIKPPHFYEYVFPGVHSDIGGSYRVGEGGRGKRQSDKLGIIPLQQMHAYAVSKGVPFIAKGNWDEVQKSDFEVSPELIEIYNYYLKKVPAAKNVGAMMNSHMALYFAWKFRDIHVKLKGDHAEADRVSTTSKKFASEGTALKQQIASLKKDDDKAGSAVLVADINYSNYIDVHDDREGPDFLRFKTAKRVAATRKAETQDQFLRAQAKLDALPKMENQNAMIKLYDAQLLADAKAVYEISKQHTFFQKETNARKLRPHYKILVDAYENEFVSGKGLKDNLIISFFDNYVHDSLSPFALDATLPSDPRVVYMGGDEKLKYANLDSEPSDSETKLATAESGFESKPKGQMV